MTEFKIGDRVRCIKTGMYTKMGDEFIVDSIEMDNILVIKRISDKERFIYHFKEANVYLELIKPINKFEFIERLPKTDGHLVIDFHENGISYYSNSALDGGIYPDKYKITVEKLDE